MKKIYLTTCLLLVFKTLTFCQDTTYFVSESGITNERLKAKYFTTDKLSNSCKVTLYNVGNLKKYAVVNLKNKKTSDYFVQDGEITHYFDNGVISDNGLMKEGEKVGIWKTNYQTGNPNETLNYDFDRKDFDNKLQPFEYRIEEYYDNFGKILVENGNGVYFFRDSVTVFTVDIKKGVPHGKGDGNYKNMKFSETYKNGKLKKGSIEVEKDKTIEYDEIFSFPEFEGGVKEMYMFLGQNIKYPADAQRKNKEGKVFVKFEIEKDGEIKKIELLKGVFPSINEESLRVIKLMSFKFKPGKKRGILEPMFFTMPIVFQLE